MLNWGHCFRDAYGSDVPPRNEDKVIPLTCPICGADTDAEIKSRFTTKGSKYIRLPDVIGEMYVINYFLRCTRCSGALLLMWSYGEEFPDRNKTAGKLLFPFRTDAFDIEELNLDIIPKSIYEDIKQAELSLYANAFLGAGLLLRRACQNICRDKKCTGRNLLEEIDDLVNKNIITQDMLEMAHSIRMLLLSHNVQNLTA
jgi:hypothetical protein